LGVALLLRAAKSHKGHSRVANLCGMLHDQMARVELGEIFGKSDFLLMQRFRSSCWLPQKPVCLYAHRGVFWVLPAISITERRVVP
jgi:hypothetical protein